MKKAVRSFRVHIDRPVVKAGRLLSGRISFCLRETVGVKSITLLFEGHSKTSYGCATTPLDGDGGGSPTYLFRVQVPMTPCLFEYEKDGKLKVPAGEHELPFGFPVPLASPTTFAGKHGYILYRCKAKLCTSLSLGQADFRAEAPFRVIGLEDLNWHPYTLLPVSWCDEYKRRVLCMTKTDVTVVMRLPRTGYALGETIPVSLEITNRHRRHVVKGSSVELVQRVEYECGAGRQRVTKQTIGRLTKGAIAPLSTQIWEEEPLLVPKDAAPSFLRGCDRISVHYEVAFSLQPGIHIAVPIIIGTREFDGATLKKIVQALPWKTANDSPTGCDPKAQLFDHPLPTPPFVGLGIKTEAFNSCMPPYAQTHIRLPSMPPPPPPPPMMYPPHQRIGHPRFSPPPPPPSFQQPHRRGSEFMPTSIPNWSFTGGKQHWQQPQFPLYKQQEEEDDKHVLKIEEIE